MVPDPKPKTPDAKPIGEMTPKELLTLWAYLGALANARRASTDSPHIAPASRRTARGSSA